MIDLRVKVANIEYWLATDIRRSVMKARDTFSGKKPAHYQISLLGSERLPLPE